MFKSVRGMATYNLFMYIFRPVNTLVFVYSENKQVKYLIFTDKLMLRLFHLNVQQLDTNQTLSFHVDNIV